MVEWKYDGIRGQVVKRSGQVWVWSRGEELVTERFPEIVALAQALPDGTVLDGEILVWVDEPVDPPGTVVGRPAPFSLLQQRIGRKTLTKKVLADAPVTFMAYDLLEQDGVDLRAQPQREPRGEGPPGHRVPRAPVDAGGADAHEHLTAGGHGVGDLREPQPVGRAVSVLDDGLHDAS